MSDKEHDTRTDVTETIGVVLLEEQWNRLRPYFEAKTSAEWNWRALMKASIPADIKERAEMEIACARAHTARQMAEEAFFSQCHDMGLLP